MLTYSPSPVSWLTMTLTPGMRPSESATLASGSLPRSSAEITSTTPNESFLLAIALSVLWRWPVTMMASPAPSVAAVTALSAAGVSARAMPGSVAVAMVKANRAVVVMRPDLAVGRSRAGMKDTPHISRWRVHSFPDVEAGGNKCWIDGGLSSRHSNVQTRLLSRSNVLFLYHRINV